MKPAAIISVFLLSFILLPISYGHDVTLTYTTLNITPPDATIAINIPQGNLEMLYPNRTLDEALAQFPSYMRERLLIRSEAGSCTSDIGTRKDGETIKATAAYRCGSMQHLNLSYRMFFEISSTHENILDIYIPGANITSRLLLSEGGIQNVNFPIEKIIQDWRSRNNITNVSSAENASDVTRTAGNASAAAAPDSGRANQPFVFGANETSNENAVASFFVLGVEHIFTGYDHILFIIGILLITTLFWQLTKIVTSFTIAHSVTLIVATLGFFALSPRLTEPLIALTIVFIAAENVYFLRQNRKHNRKQKTKHKHSKLFGDPSKRWRITFALGLIHGFGFSSVLRDIGLPEKDLIPALLSFNLGVEAGQLAIAAVLFPLLIYSRRYKWQPRAILYLSVIIGIVGAFWFFQRVFF